MKTLVMPCHKLGFSYPQDGMRLTSLLDLTKGYAEHEYKTITEIIQARRSITKDSSPDDVRKQENIIAEAMGKIMIVAESYPDLKADSAYMKTMDGVNQYENMVRTQQADL